MAKMLHVKGISAKGKQRVKQWGDEWVILRETQQVLFDQKEGPWYFIQAASDITEAGKSTRWIHSEADLHFHILAKFGD